MRSRNDMQGLADELAFERDVIDELVAAAKKRSCKKCGCTDDRACAGGCFWIGPRLCSACGKPAKIFAPLRSKLGRATRVQRGKPT